MPIRSEYGYHLIKVTDKKKAMGRVQIAHLLISVPQNANEFGINDAKGKANEIMNKLKNGEKFDTLVKQYSDDKGSANKGGILPEFGVNRMIPEFIVAISKLEKAGDFSEPILSRYGWHIIKLVERKEIKTLEELKNEIKQKVAKDERANKSKESFLAKVKTEYKFTENLMTVKEFYKLVTDSVFTNSWKAEEAKKLTAKMFSIGNKNYTQTDFAGFLASIRNENPSKENLEMYVNRNYKEYVERSLMQYADNKLEEKYPDFRSLMKEYHDGILLFDLTDKNVWTKAIKDTSGLKDFYQKNAMNYIWGERLDATIFTFNESKIKAEDARKFVEKIYKKQYGSDFTRINEQIKKLSKDSTIVTYVHEKYAKADNKLIDQIKWQEGIAETIKDGANIIIVLVNKKLAPEQKTLVEAKGIVTADYQNYIEKEWLKSLRKRYQFSVNK